MNLIKLTIWTGCVVTIMFLAFCAVMFVAQSVGLDIANSQSDAVQMIVNGMMNIMK